MRLTLGKIFLALSLATSPVTVVGQVLAPPPEAEVEALRAELELAPDRAEWDRIARQLLLALDRSGLGDGNEARWLIDRLLATAPDDPLLRWRRAISRNDVDDVMDAIADMEYLATSQPDHPLAVRARRALPAMYLRAGRAGKSAAADELLLERGLADPVAVLTRLAHTYELLALPGRVLDTLERLQRLAPDKVQYDPDIAWLAAEAQIARGDPITHARAMIRFANVFPEDRRRGAALIAAASSLSQIAKHEVAFDLVNETLSLGLDDETRTSALFLRGELNESLGRKEAAIADYDVLLRTAADSTTSERALERRIDLEVETRGSESALTMLAALTQHGDRFSKPLARENFVRLMASMTERLAVEETGASFHIALSRRAGVVRPPEPIVVAAARLDRRLALDRADDRLPEHPAAPLVREADRLMREGDPRAACRAYRKAQGVAHLVGAVPRPTAEWIGVRIAGCLAREGNDDAARRAAAELVARDPGEPARLLAERILSGVGGESS